MENQLYIEPQRGKNEGVFSPYGMPYRFGFYYNKGLNIHEDDDTAETIYYGMHFGNINSDATFEMVGCWIAKSLFDDGIVEVYQYSSGPIVVFSEDNVVGWATREESTLWGQPAPQTCVFNEAPDNSDRTTFLEEGNIEERALIYTFKLDTTRNAIDYVEKHESPAYPWFTTFPNEYCLVRRTNGLYIGLPEKFIIRDNRPDIDNIEYSDREEEEESGLFWDEEDEFVGDNEETRIALVPTGTAGTMPADYVPDPEDPVPIIGSGNFLSIEIQDDTAIAGKIFFHQGGLIKDHYPTEIIANMTEKQNMLLYAKIILGSKDNESEVLNRNFEVELAHVIQEEPALPEETSGEVFVPLCEVSLKKGIYSITRHHEYGYKAGGGKLRMIGWPDLPDGDEDKIALRWDNTQGEWQAVPVLDAGTSYEGDFLSGEKVIVGAKVGDEGLIQLVEKALDTTGLNTIWGDGGNVIIRWDNGEWQAAPPLDIVNLNEGAFLNGEKVIVGAKVGNAGLIQLIEKTLTFPDPLGLTANSITFQGGKIEYDGTEHMLYQYDVKVAIAANGTLSYTSYDSTNYTSDGGGHRHVITTSVSHATQHPE
jgi:hypothetical protein